MVMDAIIAFVSRVRRWKSACEIGSPHGRVPRCGL
jgi:hypothetical protein